MILHFKPPSSTRAAEQIALNAQAVAAAALAANAYQRGSPKDHSSFNPYRYFSSSLDQAPVDYIRPPSPHSGAYRRTPILNSPGHNDSYYSTTSIPNRSPYNIDRKPLIENDNIRLFSVDSNVLNRSRYQDTNNASTLGYRNNNSRTFDNSFSDNE